IASVSMPFCGDCTRARLSADGKIYTAARNGKMSVVEAGKTFDLLSVNDMQETITSSPVISGGRIYVRTFDALYAVGK
ncbi:MAG: PQQ-binding-like beta-propeller repeat protein, partial [Pirellulaceae bacterium]